MGIKKKSICYNCIKERFLSNEVFRIGKLRVCSYCRKRGKGISIHDLSTKIEKAFEAHYTKSSNYPEAYELALLNDKESNFEWDRSGDQVIDAIELAAEIPREAAEEVQKYLNDKNYDFDLAAMGEEWEFDNDSYYVHKDISDQNWQREWRSFENSLKTQARFFNPTAKQHLDTIFDEIENLKTSRGDSLIIEAGPDSDITSIFRARAFYSEKKLKQALLHPDQQLGPPPFHFSKPCRMNAKGIHVLYGASHEEIALAEVRPPVGSSVVIGKFEITRKLKLINLSAFSQVTVSGSIFDVNYRSRLERITFLNKLSSLLVRPVMPDDEDSEYLVAQVVSDYLATDDRLFDGILYSSIQADTNHILEKHFNLVLFSKSSEIEPIKKVKGAYLSVYGGPSHADDYRNYTVFEDHRKISHESEVETKEDMDVFPDWQSDSSEAFERTLILKRESIKVYEINSIKINAEEIPYSYHFFPQ